MSLDPVHDLQAVFRELMSALAAPGSARDIGALAGRIDFETAFPKPMLAIALALLDAETVFCVSSPSREEREGELARLTSARRGPVEEAEFVFVLGDGSELADALAAARAGTLVDPHLGATQIALAGSIEGRGRLALSGPGVVPGAGLEVGLGREWIAARAAKNREYPLGVDMIFVDPEGRVAALPRTTGVAEGR